MRISSSRFFAGVVLVAASITAVGCVSGDGDASFDDSYALDDSRADGSFSRPLRNRATWLKRVEACREDFDIAINAPAGNEESDTIVPVIDAYTECLEASNDRTLGLIGRNIDANLYGESPYDNDWPAVSFENYRTAGNDFCSRAVGLATETVFDTDAGLVAITSAAYCRLANEIALVDLIANTVTFADVNNDNVEVDSHYDVTPLVADSGVHAAAAPVCTAALDTAMTDAITTADMNHASWNFSSCLREATLVSINASVPTSIAPQLSGTELETYTTATRDAFLHTADTLEQICSVVSTAGGTGTIVGTATAGCTGGQIARIAGYFDRYAPVAADAAADPDSNGIPGMQPAEESNESN